MVMPSSLSESDAGLPERGALLGLATATRWRSVEAARNTPSMPSAHLVRRYHHLPFTIISLPICVIFWTFVVGLLRVDAQRPDSRLGL